MAYEATLPLSSPSARFTHGSPEPDAPALEKRLRKAVRRTEPIAIGTAAEPYEPVGHRHAAARSLLLACSRVDGLEISITTRSPLIVGDLGLLVELDRRHAVTVHVLMRSLDLELMRVIETLAGEGIDTRILCGPVMPGPGDGEAVLRPLFAQARAAGASDVGLRLAARSRLLPRRPETERLLATFRRLRLEHGFPRSVPGRG